MHPDTPPSDRPTRLRLVDIRVGPGRQLHLGGALAGVLAEHRDRTAAANLIASTVAGPRPAEADGSIDVGGEVVSVHTLPSPLLPPGVARVIDGDLLRSQWRTSCARRRDELAATHASYRLERYRIEAALERARSRRVPLPRKVEAAMAPAASVAPPRPPEIVAPQPDPAPPTAPEPGSVDNEPLRAQLRTLVSTLDALPAAALPEGGLLADAWDAHTLLARVRDAVDELPTNQVERLEQRVDAARAAVANTTSGVSEEMRVRIEQCHLGVLEAEAYLLAAKRRHRSRAVEGYEHAVAAELMALADAGIDSYASFVLAVDEATSAANAAARRAAQSELAEARADFDAAIGVPDMPTRAELEAREAQMRDRAAELLERAPGADPAAELRALRVPTEARTEVLDEIAGVLRDHGVVPTGNLTEFARWFGASTGTRAGEPPAPPPPPAPSPPPAETSGTPVPQRMATIASRAVDVETLEQQRFAHDRALEQLDTDLAGIDAVYNAPLSALGAADLTHAVEVLLDLYRRGQLLGGRLPLVLDGALDGLGAAAREAAVEVLLEADDLQAIVVSEDVEVMQSLARAGGTIVRWPEREPTEYDPTRLQPTPTRGA